MMKIRVFLVLLVVLPSELDAVCPTGWKLFKANCYKKFPGPSSWTDAKDACVGEKGQLAEIKDQAENEFVANQVGGNAWIGISRCHTSSTCLLDFTPAIYVNWAAGQPDNKPNNQGLGNNDFAVEIQANGKWADFPKQEDKAFICKRPEDPCKDNACNPDGSKCVDGDCICNPGYSGKYCYVEPCDNDPCQNGGSCEPAPAGYTCKCVNFYSGKNCEVPPPCEAKKPCKNGDCVNVNANDYKCNCKTGWTGKNCDERPCDKKPCVNAKQCINKGNTYECVCLPGWTGTNCDKEGSGTGDPHYLTFDKKRYDFMGRCEYVYAKDCGKDHAFEVLQQNEACGRGTVSCTKSIRVLFKSTEVIMHRGGVVYVDGQRVGFPWNGEGATITGYGRGAFLSVPGLLFSVRWDGSMGIYVKINQRYEGSMCGLMGNADGNPNNDFQLPDKTITTNVAQFGNSWRKNPRCVNGIVPPDPCKKLNAAQYKAIKAKCGKMKEPPFKQCNDKITPDVRYIPNCEYDLCAMKVNPSAAWCQALDTYDAACKGKGVNIDWEGQPGFKECGDPCAKMPCFNGAECKNINRKEFKCTCPNGFSGNTCEDVVCKSGYKSRGNFCYKKMSRRPWTVAKCTGEDVFVTSENVDENAFIYQNFVKKEKKTIWMNARVCGEQKLCRNDFGTVFYHNFAGPFPNAGCAEITVERGGKWSARNCRNANYFICKHEIF